MTPHAGARLIAAALAVAGAAGCSDDDDGTAGVTISVDTGPSTGSTDSTAPVTTPSTTVSSPTTVPGPPAPPVEQLAGLALALQPWAAIDKPTAMVVRPADNTVYVASQTGQIWRLADPAAPMLALDLAAIVSAYQPGSERGLLGIAFSPADGRLFVYYTDEQAQSHLVSYAMNADGMADPNSQTLVLDVPQTGLGHKGGGMSFDGPILYLALGDGGGSNGRDAQDYTSLLGSIIRIVPRTTGPGYDFPDDNPYLNDPTKRPELWAKGLREPWGFYRDPITGDLWMADVGNHTMEEIDRMLPGEKGLNFGWYFVEGTQVNHPGGPADAVPPVFAYYRADVGPAAIGGRVYRGTAIPGLAGAYVFADMGGKTFAIGAGDQTTNLTLGIPGLVTGFASGPDGELYALTHTQGIHKIVPG